MARDDSKDPFNRVTNPDGSPIRDKDNDAPQHKPKIQFTHPAPNLAPGGAMGLRSSPKQPGVPPKETEQEQTKDVGLSTSIDDPDSPWIEGRVISMPGYTFQAKAFDEASEHGIDGGKISKLEIRKDDELVAHYDRGWDVPPQDTEVREALQRIRNGLDDRPEQPFKGFDQGKDRTDGMER